jgi:hypothetical protein
MKTVQVLQAVAMVQAAKAVVTPADEFQQIGLRRGPRLFVAAATFAAVILSSADCSSVFAQSGSGFLQGGVEHSDRMAPVQPALRVGITYDESKVEKPNPTKIWYRVPPWLAGKWQRDESNQVSRLDCRTGINDARASAFRSHGTTAWGSQRDRLSGIWDYVSLPYTTEVTSDTERDKDFCTDESIIFDSDARVILRSVYTRTALDKTNIIRSVSQMEEIDTYLPCGPGMFRQEYSMKQFDDRGNPVCLTKGWSVYKKNASPVLNGNDPSFRQYLMTTGMANLVPQ